MLITSSSFAIAIVLLLIIFSLVNGKFNIKLQLDSIFLIFKANQRPWVYVSLDFIFRLLEVVLVSSLLYGIGNYVGLNAFKGTFSKSETANELSSNPYISETNS